MHHAVVDLINKNTIHNECKTVKQTCSATTSTFGLRTKNILVIFHLKKTYRYGKISSDEPISLTVYGEENMVGRANNEVNHIIALTENMSVCFSLNSSSSMSRRQDMPSSR